MKPSTSRQCPSGGCRSVSVSIPGGAKEIAEDNEVSQRPPTTNKVMGVMGAGSGRPDSGLTGGSTHDEKAGRPASVATGEDSYRLMVDGLGQEVYENQLDLVRFQTWLVDQGLMSTGFVQSVNDAVSRHTTHFWGPFVPPPTDPFRGKIEAEARARSIGLTFQEVPYTRQDIERASLFVLDYQDTALVGFPVYYVDGPTPDSPHLTVVGKIGSLDPQELGRRLQASLRINLTVVVQEGEPLIPFSVKGHGTAPPSQP